jgi:cytoskeletal protein RodZ
MTFDPNLPRDPNLRPDRPELRTTPEAARKPAGWAPWVAVIAVLLVGGFIWMQMSAPSTTDPTTTSSTTPPAVTDQAPAPMTPTAPTNDAAPATPNTNGTQTQP